MNLGGQWTDITPEILKNPGMITDAQWTDFNHDQLPDLMTVGEWMPIQFYKNNGKSLVFDQNIPNSEGWWNTISIMDVDQDSLDDYIIGNWGLNSRIPASVEHPIKLFVKDFDQNQSIDPILCWSDAKGNYYPYNSRFDLLSQIPSLKKKILKYSTYADLTYEDLFTVDQRKGALEKKVVCFESSFLKNFGHGKFELSPLPKEAQVAPVYSILNHDFDGDGQSESLLCGNFNKSKPELGRFDANHGVMLKYTDHTFKYVSPRIHGLNLEGEIKDLKLIQTPGGSYVLIGKNNAGLELLKFN
jgi:hypothetical protein